MYKLDLEKAEESRDQIANIYWLPGGSDGKESTCNAEDMVQSLDWEDSLEEDMATHSSILAWRIPMDYGVTKTWTWLSD